jgi:hypothetical protein
MKRMFCEKTLGGTEGSKEVAQILEPERAQSVQITACRKFQASIFVPFNLLCIELLAKGRQN